MNVSYTQCKPAAMQLYDAAAVILTKTILLDRNACFKGGSSLPGHTRVS